MKRNDVASLEQLILRLHGVNTGSLNDISWAECIVGSYLHTEALGDASHVATHVTESQDTQLLALQLRACLAVVEITNGENQQTENQLGNGVGVLTRSILSHHVVSSSSSQVDIIITGTGANDDLEVLGSVEHLGISLVRTDNHRIHILHSIEKLSLLCIFFEQHQFVACSLYFFLNALDSSCCEWLFCCN